jgi:uncharacterized DUF497 family protein
MYMRFTWDPKKTRMNEQKHRVRFEDAIKAFADPYHLIDQDREMDGESRWQVIGMVDDMRILLVAYISSR